MQILSNSDGNGLDRRALMVLSTISEPGETLRRGPWCYVLRKSWKMIVAAFCFLDSLTIHVWKPVGFLFHKYSQVKTGAWVYLEYLVESTIWEIVFPQYTRVIDIQKWGERTSRSSYSCPDNKVVQEKK